MIAERHVLPRCMYLADPAGPDPIECGEPAIVLWYGDFYICKEHDALMEQAILRRRTGDRVSVVGKLVALEAAVLWTPDGEPPIGWSRERSAEIYRMLLVTLRVSPRKVASAIWGLAASIRDREIDWLDGKATARCFYHTHHGALDLLNKASDRYYFEEAQRKGWTTRLTGFQRDRELTKIGDLIWASTSGNWRGNSGE